MYFKVLGILSILLVPASLLFGLFGLKTNNPNWFMSISDAYFSNAGVLMIGLLAATGIYFLTYKGYDKRDRIVSLIEGICALLIVLFPKNPNIDTIKFTGLFNLPVWLSHIIHVTASAIFFIALGYSLVALFTLSDSKEKTAKKITRNIIYYISGIIIFICVVLTGVYGLNWLKVPEKFPFMMIVEGIMLVVFGFSFIVKSGAIKALNDE